MSARRSAISVLLLAVLAACTSESEKPEARLAGATMGTEYHVRIVNPPRDVALQALEASLQAALDDIEARMSTWLPESEVSRFNAFAGDDWFAVSADTQSLVALAEAVSQMSGGAFDITIGPVVDLWGFGPEAARVTPPDDAEIAAAMDRVGHSKLQSREDPPGLRKADAALAIDLSAIAKGHAVDRVAAVLDQGGYADYLVEVGGELRVRGTNRSGTPWSVAVEDPLAVGRAVHRVLHLSDTAIATSGDYRNFFQYEGERYSHSIDARTGWPVSHRLVSVTVLDESAALADALATAMLLLGPEAASELARRAQIPAYFLVRDGEELAESWSPAFEQAEVM